MSFDPLTHEFFFPAVAVKKDERNGEVLDYKPRFLDSWKDAEYWFQQCFGAGGGKPSDVVPSRGHVQCPKSASMRYLVEEWPLRYDYEVDLAGHERCDYNGVVAYFRPKLWDSCYTTMFSTSEKLYPGNAALSRNLTSALACVTKRIEYHEDWCHTHPDNPQLNITGWPFSMTTLNDVQLVVQGLAIIEEGLDDPQAVAAVLPMCMRYIDKIDPNELSAVQDVMEEQEAEVQGSLISWLYYLRENPAKAIVSGIIAGVSFSFAVIFGTASFVARQGITNFWSVVTFFPEKLWQGLTYVYHLLPRLKPSIQRAATVALSAGASGRWAMCRSFIASFVKNLGNTSLMIVPKPLLDYYQKALTPHSTRPTA